MTQDRQDIVNKFRKFAEDLCNNTKPTVKNKIRQGRLGELTDRLKSAFKNYKEMEDILEVYAKVLTRGLKDDALQEELNQIAEDLTVSWLDKYVRGA